jgi:sugar lactone lactonase YvrE
MREVELLLDCQNQCGESPIWDPVTSRLSWTDTEKPMFFTLETGGGGAADAERATVKPTEVKADWLIQAVGRRKAGGWIAVVRDGFAAWDPEAARSRFLGNPVEGKAHLAMNDGAVGPDGRFYAGSFNGEVLESPDGQLWRLDHDGRYACIQDGLVLPNGIAFSPDERTMYVTEMWARTITAFDFHPSSGTVSRRRILVRVPEDEGYPDGLIADSEGFLWSGHWQGFRVTRYDPDGKKERHVAVPVPTATCVAFGGPDLDELYITTAKKGLNPRQLRDYPRAGDLYRVRPGARGRIEPSYLG